MSRAWLGETVVCIACGPSLVAEDVEAVRGRTKVIVINSSYRMAPWADVLYSSDHPWWKYHKGVPEFSGPKYAVAQSPGRQDTLFDVTVLRNTGDSGLELSPDGLKTGRNSGAAAINLAVHFGAARILLLGYDMQVGQRGESHWFGHYPASSGLRRHSPYELFHRLMATMVTPLADLGIEVFNCSRETALPCFPRMSITDSLLHVGAQRVLSEALL